MDKKDNSQVRKCATNRQKYIGCFSFVQVKRGNVATANDQGREKWSAKKIGP
jgi:hypothetical protein